MDRMQIIRDIEEAIGHRRLIWVGTRGTDAQPLLEIDQFEGLVGLVAPLGVPSWDDGDEQYLERLSTRRVDLNQYSVDEDRSSARQELQRRLRRMISPGTVVLAYRPTGFLASAYFPRIEDAAYLGVFHGAQAAYEHKPWVETELAAHGVRTIPWRYFCDDDAGVQAEWTHGRRCVLRANYSDGGVGLTTTTGDDFAQAAPAHDGGFYAVAPFLSPNVPINVSGCVFADGTVTTRSPSLQLIGIDACTNRPFGYCGNDFAAAYDALGEDGLDELQEMVVRSGRWLHAQGYRGAFGIDALAHAGDLYLAEINPRFQGSSAAGSSILAEAGVSDIYLDHLCSHLQLGAPCTEVSLREQAALQAQDGSRLAQVVCYNTGNPRQLKYQAVIPDLDYGDLKGCPEEGVTVDSEAMFFKMFVRDTVTSDGFKLPRWLVDDIETLTDQLFAAPADSDTP